MSKRLRHLRSLSSLAILLIAWLWACAASGQDYFPDRTKLCVLNVTLGAPDTLYVTLANNDLDSFIDYPVVQLVDANGRIVGNVDELIQLPGMGSGTFVHRLPTTLTSLPPGFTATVVVKDALTLKECSLAWPDACSGGDHTARVEALGAYEVRAISGHVLVSGLLPSGMGRLALLGADGRPVKEVPVAGAAMVLDLSGIPTGAYWLEYRVGRYARIRHIIVP